MTYTTTVTQKGQITLPKSIRTRLNIKTREKVEIKIADNHIKIFPTADILNLAGFLNKKVKRTGSVLNARDSFEKTYSRV